MLYSIVYQYHVMLCIRVCARFWHTLKASITIFPIMHIYIHVYIYLYTSYYIYIHMNGYYAEIW